MIKLEPQQMRDLATYISTKGGEIVDLVNAMDTEIDTQTADWEGKAKEAYLSTYEEILPVLNTEFPEIISTLAQRLTTAANAIEENDQAIYDALLNS